MATILEERESLKIRIGKGGGADRLVVIDHTSGENLSGTATEVFYALGGRVEKGEGSHVIHIVDQAKEKDRKRTNPDKSTRMSLNCRTPEQWSEMQMQKERYFSIAVDPNIAIDLMIKALGAFSDNVIADWVRQGHEDRPGPPRAEIPAGEELPEWMRD